MSSPLNRFAPPRIRNRSRSSSDAASVAPEGLKPFESLKTIPKSSLVGRGGIKILDLDYIGSYNWLDGPQATIIATPFQVQADSGPKYLDQNTFRPPASSLPPLLRVVGIESPGFRWPSVDLITDRNGLRKLMRWLRDPAAREFRIDTQLVGDKTMLFSRWEKSSMELLDKRVNKYGRPIQTYVFAFEKATTRPAKGCEGSTGYHRIVAYDFGGLNIVVRFEPRSSTDSDLEDLAAALVTTSISEPKDAHGIHVRRAGAGVPQSNLVELTTLYDQKTTNSGWWELRCMESYPQLFLSQNPHFFLALHNRGRFARLVFRRGDLEVYERESTAVFLPESLLGRFDR
ncbi:hypothetical protein FIBSPDRAFT_922616 [Athelia psychrophila]|uniref:Geranylgeranyl pyrophosphate synthetase n=1 Tax=Athelia psychrophila TaxID=1759441 RepID=A0A165XS89_9AGAM|nr:hypothetical protein FIBSPDRAFT_922616 [Fibularhizoctonia sp. CBS 109695]